MLNIISESTKLPNCTYVVGWFYCWLFEFTYFHESGEFRFGTSPFIKGEYRQCESLSEADQNELKEAWLARQYGACETAEKTVKILNLVIEDRADPKAYKTYVHSFSLREDVDTPERALRAAVLAYLNSGTHDSKQALEHANGCYNWGDAMVSVPDIIFEKHGLTRLYQTTEDIIVNHDEVLCNNMEEEL